MGKGSVTVAMPTFWNIFSATIVAGEFAIFTNDSLTILAEHESSTLETRNRLLKSLDDELMIVRSH